MSEETGEAILKMALAVGLIALAVVVGIVIGLRIAFDSLECTDRIVETGQCVAYVLEATQ